MQLSSPFTVKAIVNYSKGREKRFHHRMKRGHRTVGGENEDLFIEYLENT